MNRGEVRWHRFNHLDKRRPVLVLTRDSALDYLREVTIAPITSTIRDIPSEVLLTQADGMPRDSVINCDHLQTVPKGRLGRLITTLSPRQMHQVAEAICFALSL